jgi:hypothetical protein
VKWIHAYPDQPVLIYSELDHERWELRKVEIFSDGRIWYADAEVEVGDTGLGQMPLPSVEEIAADPQFVPEVISKAEFEKIWAMATALTGFAAARQLSPHRKIRCGLFESDGPLSANTLPSAPKFATAPSRSG